MAYVRRKGNQLAIVVGERNPETKQVEQRVLFTIYSRPEALDVLGRSADKGASRRFEALVSRQHPDITFNWKALRKAIAADLDHLPESYAYKETRLTGRFREDLVDFARSLVLADPQHLVSAGALIRENKAALEYLSEIISWRLRTCAEREPNEWNADNPYFWRFTMQGKGVPADALEHAEGLWERRDLVHAEAAFKILVEAFPDYADGYNYLGLIALERRAPSVAEGHFRKAIEIGKKLLPKRVARSSLWRDHDTRPYIRGLRNLTDVLLRTARYTDAMKIADQLDVECADDIVASEYRAVIAMNTGDWKLAADSAARIREAQPEHGLVEALARVEMRELQRALEVLLHAAMNRPRAVRIVAGINTNTPKTSSEVQDHNAGVRLREELAGYLGKKRGGVAFLRRVVGDLRVARSMERVEELHRRWYGEDPADHVDQSVLQELTEMQTPEFAAERARLLADLADGGNLPGLTEPAPKRSSKRRRSPATAGRSLH